MADDEDVLTHIADQLAGNSLALHALAHDYSLYRRQCEAQKAELRRQLERAREIVRQRDAEIEQMRRREHLDDEAIDRALQAWTEEGSVAYSAHINNYVPEGMPEGPGRDAALTGLRAADEEAWNMNRNLMRRAISSALKDNKTVVSPRG